MSQKKSPLVLVATLAALSLAGCGGGGSGGAINSPTSVQSLTGASAPTETLADQTARAPSIFSRSDSFITSSLYGETSSSELPTFVISSSCSGTTCRFRDRTSGFSLTVNLSDLSISSSNGQTLGTKQGITVIRAEGRQNQIDYKALGAWMYHSVFSVQEEGGDFEGVRIDAREGLAGGDLTRSRPLGNATWQGLMVGMPTTGANRGDRLQGDATLTYSLNTQMLGAAFTNIQNIDRLRAHSVPSLRFTGVPVNANGEYRAGTTGNRIQGGFYGPGHSETAGIFEQFNIVGSFGATRE
ncbi:MAG: hypothetical protein OXI10_03965 [Gammaproteobacteria bacterium]|nr:hypothetical protein [Gammaproteobacteria bacterium]MXY64430.1 transferrin-binding protein-like solute binding protein [Gammaproteobacteria bacterium]